LQKAKVVVVARLDPAALIVLETKKNGTTIFSDLATPGSALLFPSLFFSLSLSLSVLFRARKSVCEDDVKRREEKERKKVLLLLLPKI
jgi:hypothetical protein